jgi:recombination protein RecR
MHTPQIEQLIKQFSKLPGLGPRSARRAVLELLREKDTLLKPLIDSLQETADTVVTCSECGNLDTSSPCSICINIKRQDNVICVVEDVADLWAIERSKLFTGKYHVLGGTLSALEGRTPEDLNIELLIRRASNEMVEEVILALNATVDGQTTAHYLSDRLAEANVKISRLAQGIPMGGELDYLDEGTLGAALKARLAV